RVQVAALEGGGMTASRVDARLLIHSATRSTLQLRTGRVSLPAPLQEQAGELQGITLTCANPVVREPLLACPRLSLALRTRKFATLKAEAQARYDLQRETLQAGGTGPAIAGAAPTFNLDWSPRGWKAE